MSQITWRNVDAPDTSSALKGVELANKLFSQAIDSADTGLGFYRGLQQSAADRAIALRAAQIQDPAAYRQAMIDRSLIGLDGENASLSTIQNIGAGVNTLAERDMVQNKAVDQLHASANAFQNEQWDKEAIGVADELSLNRPTAVDALRGYKEWRAANPDVAPEVARRVEARLNQAYGNFLGRGPTLPATGGVGVPTTGSVPAAPGATGTPATAALSGAAASSSAIPVSNNIADVSASVNMKPEEYTLQALQQATSSNALGNMQKFDVLQTDVDTSPLQAVEQLKKAGYLHPDTDGEEGEGMILEIKRRYAEANPDNPNLSNTAAAFILARNNRPTNNWGDQLGAWWDGLGEDYDPSANGRMTDLKGVDADIAAFASGAGGRASNTLASQQKQAQLLKGATAQRDALQLQVKAMESAPNKAELESNGSLPAARARLEQANAQVQVANDAIASDPTNKGPFVTTTPETVVANLGLGSEAKNYSPTFNKQWADVASPSGKKKVFGYQQKVENGVLIETGSVLTGGGKSEQISTRTPLSQLPPDQQASLLKKSASSAKKDNAVEQVKTPFTPNQAKLNRAQYEPLVKTAELENGLPEGLLAAVIDTESSWNPEATSNRGAKGLVQFMPDTAKQFGLTPEDRTNPEKSIAGGAKFLKYLYKKYNGDLNLTLAAYNAGEGNVQKYGGIPPFEQTQEYVPKVLAKMKRTKEKS